MIKYTLRATMAFSAAVLMLNSSCKKTPDNTSSPTSNPIQYDRTQANKAFAPLQKTSQKFTITAGVAKKIIGTEGTILSFYPNSFKDKNGNIITSGTINIELTELYKLGDMIAHRTSTSTSNGVLTSGGEVNIKATMNGQEVFANTYGLGFKSPATAPSKPMGLYYGETSDPDSTTTWRIVDWVKGQFVSGTSSVTDSSIAVAMAPYFLFDSCTSFNWVNCDHAYDSASAYVKIKMHFPDNKFKNSPFPVTLAYTSINVATKLGIGEYNSANTATFEGYAPLKRDCKFVLVIPKSLTEFYYYEQSGQVTDGMEINANTTLISASDVKAKLNAL